MIHLSRLLSIWLLFTSTTLFAQDSTDSLRVVTESLRTMFDTKDIAVLPSYTFQHQVHYTSFKISWKGEQNEAFDLLFNTGSGIIGMRTQREQEGRKMDMLMVFDHPALTTVNFVHSDTLNVAMRMRIPDPSKSKEQGVVNFKKTKEQRTIAGQRATKWTAENGNEDIELWVAPVAVDVAPVFRAWGKLHGQPEVTRGDFESGLVLAGSMKYKEGEKAHFTFEATEVKLDTPHNFSSEGYTVQ